jgi:hypothetical protein
MPDITLITPPDKLFNNNPSVLLVNPSDTIKNDLNEALKDTELNINIYLYEVGPISWVLDIAQSVDHILMDLDNINDKWIIGYLLNFGKTFYLTSEANSVYNVINVNRIYDINQFIKGVNNFETTQQLEQ